MRAHVDEYVHTGVHARVVVNRSKAAVARRSHDQVSFVEGDVIEYRSFQGPLRIARVAKTFTDPSNDRPAFAGVLLTVGKPTKVWGYTDQVVRVVEFGGTDVTDLLRTLAEELPRLDDSTDAT